MTVDRKQMLDELKSIEDPKLIQEGDFQSDNILRIVSSQGGYRLEIDAFPIDGPFEISSDEYTEMSKLDEEGDDGDGLLDLSEDQLEMVQAGCEPEMPYYRYQMDVRAEGPIFSEDRDELVTMLIEDVMDLVDCQLWDEMKDTELEDWYTWSTY
ncbi:MAG: hypothetical protein V2J65_35585, partial [Desulfobacteraceae bacterium]|nr:hypothetical protein [Desulfobacteraceae bacterium]